MEVLRKCLSCKEGKLALDTLPKSLDETYERILEGIDERYRVRAARALQWPVFSERPLTVKELAEASIVNPDADTPFDIDDRFVNPLEILKGLSGLVTTSFSKSRRLELGYDHGEIAEIVSAHFSVQEYLLSDRIQPTLAQIFRTEGFASQQIIARSCLHYIDFYESTSDESLTIEFKSYPILNYSTKHWGGHVRACKNTKWASTDLVCQFLHSESSLNTWESIQQSPGTELYDMGSPLYWAAYLQLAFFSWPALQEN
jgi:hypothetical protein